MAGRGLAASGDQDEPVEQRSCRLDGFDQAGVVALLELIQHELREPGRFDLGGVARAALAVVEGSADPADSCIAVWDGTLSGGRVWSMWAEHLEGSFPVWGRLRACSSRPNP